MTEKTDETYLHEWVLKTKPGELVWLTDWEPQGETVEDGGPVYYQRSCASAGKVMGLLIFRGTTIMGADGKPAGVDMNKYFVHPFEADAPAGAEVNDSLETAEQFAEGQARAWARSLIPS